MKEKFENMTMEEISEKLANPTTSFGEVLYIANEMRILQELAKNNETEKDKEIKKLKERIKELKEKLEEVQNVLDDEY